MATSKLTDTDILLNTYTRNMGLYRQESIKSVSIFDITIFSRLDVFIYYDDLFDNEFLWNAKTRIRAVMAIAQERFYEKKTLKTKIKINVVDIQHMKGKDWGNTKWKYVRIELQGCN